MTEIPDAMRGSGLKYLFYTCSLLLLVIMIAFSRNAAVTCDEVLHYQQSEAVYAFFKTHGADKSALETPVSHLKYYGQSYDNVTTFIIKWLGIEDIYGFRHFMSVIAGWLVIFISALFAIWLADVRTGIFVLFLFAVSPTFMGHAQNNLKDVPFALGYISGLWFSLKIINSEGRPGLTDILLLTLSIGFALSIRAGGLLLICYLFLFLVALELYRFYPDGKFDVRRFIWKFLLFIMISGVAYFLGILLWPYALSDPARNVIDSLRVMSHFPDTFRQIFEGKAEWSDYMPWYYLPKTMLITIPLIVLGGFFLFFIFPGKIRKSNKALLYVMVIFAILFPVIYAILGRSNLYSSWRQFLFIYPAIVIIAATGLNFLAGLVRKKYLKIALLIAIGLLAVHPVRFMNNNHRYWYLYYNQLVGGLKGASGNYETDYYYLGQTEASEWILNHLSEKGISGPIKIGATYSVSWQFRNHPEITTFYMRNEERSMYDWDYAIITNRYIRPTQLKENKWPPKDAVHVIYADSVPICAVLERKSKDDYLGYQALTRGETNRAIEYFSSAIKENCKDEMIFFNFAAALVKEGYLDKADSLLREGLKLNPESEPIMMYLGNIAASGNRREDAKDYYRRLIGINRKYLDAYVKLARLMGHDERKSARSLLWQCLGIDPNYRPAITALADTYRDNDPEIARKYDEMANRVK